MNADIHHVRDLPGEDRVVEAGGIILREGEASSRMYYVLQGMGLRYKTLRDGHRQVVGFMMQGDVVGLQAGLNGEINHTAEATTRMRVRVTSRSAVIRTFSEDAERAIALARSAVEEERALGEALATIGQREAIARVAWLLCKFHDRMSATGLVSDGVLPLPYRQQDVADALGLSLVHTNKTLAKLKRDNIAVWSGKKLVIHDFDALQSLLDGVEAKAA